MTTKKTTAWEQDNRDLLVELKTQMSDVKDSISGLRSEVKEIKDGMKSDIEFLKNDKISRAEVVRIQTDGLVIHNDHESRLRFIERYVTLALGAIALGSFALSYFHPFVK